MRLEADRSFVKNNLRERKFRSLTNKTIIMRIIPKEEIVIQSKSNLAGKCALKIYFDGNITFSAQAAELMNIHENKFFNLCEEENNFYLSPSNVTGFKPSKRRGKQVYVYYSKHLVNYLKTRLNIELSSKNPCEFLIKKTRQR